MAGGIALPRRPALLPQAMPLRWPMQGAKGQLQAVHQGAVIRGWGYHKEGIAACLAPVRLW